VFRWLSLVATNLLLDNVIMFLRFFFFKKNTLTKILVKIAQPKNLFVKITQLVERRMSHVQYKWKVEVRPTPRISAGFNSTGGICVICTSLGGVGLSTCAFLPVTHVTSKLVNYVIFTNKFLIMTSWIIILVTVLFFPPWQQVSVQTFEIG
jgi:hypothetical protein